MASTVATAERVNWAIEQLMAGRGSSAVVSEMSERWGITRRQAQRLTKRAHQTLVQDLDQVERVDMTAQLIALLMASAERAIRSGNAGAVVGISRELRALVGLGVDHAPRLGATGKFGSSVKAS